MIQKIKNFASEHPLYFLLLLAFSVRLLAAIFAKGWLMFDDHYLIVEAAGSWAKGGDVNHWLPWTEGNKGPHFISFFYVGIVWIFFEILNFFGIESPENQMFLLRLMHGLYSLLIVYFSYKITLKLSDKKTAFTVGLILALLGYFPSFSVKQLAEMVCIPPILGAYYYMIRSNSFVLRDYIFAGVLAGLSIGLRYQSGLIFLGVGFVLIFQKKWRELFVLTIVSSIVFFLTQISDLILWGKPFAQLQEYIFHNSTNSENYVTSPWYNYILTILGFLVPPISVILLFGFLKKFKKHILFVLPVLLFLVFHSLYPNKQERFILSILPLIIIVGMIGWNEFKSTSKFWTKNQKLLNGFWAFFWTVNILVLIVFSTSYSKKQYAETMVYLSKKKDITTFVLENSNVPRFTMVPLYYYGSWDYQYVINKQHNIVFTQANILAKREHPYPNYIVFYNDENLEARRAKAEEAFGELEFDTIIEPGSLDKILAFVNPHNKIERVHIYKIKNIPLGAP